MLPIRGSACRPYLLRHYWGTAIASPQASFSCCPRFRSTLCPNNIAELLRPGSAPSSSPQPAPCDDQSLKLNGYVRTVRKQKRVAFAAIGDGSTLQTVQAVLSPELAEGSVEHFIYTVTKLTQTRLTTGVAVTVTGKWILSPAQGQSHELQVEDVRILGENDAAVCYSDTSTMVTTSDSCPLIDLPNTKEVSDCRVPSNSTAFATSITRQCSDLALEVFGHSSGDQLLRAARLCPVPSSNHHILRLRRRRRSVHRCTRGAVFRRVRSWEPGQGARGHVFWIS